MKTEHVLVLKEFLEQPELLDVHSYTGYKGGVVLRLRSSSERFVNDVLGFCQGHDIEASFKYNHNLGTNEIFVVAPDDVYELRK